MQRVAAVVDATFENAVLPMITAPGSGPADLAISLSNKGLNWSSDVNSLADLLHGRAGWHQELLLAGPEHEASWNLERVPPAAALRWAAYTDTTPGQAEAGFLDRLRQLVTELTRAEVTTASPRRQVTASLDRWLMARLYQAIASATSALESSEPRRAAEELEALTADLLDWYVPLRPGSGRDVAGILGQILAPFVPHLAEAIYHHTVGGTADSVHGTRWPEPQPDWADPELLAQVVILRRLAALGQAARNQAQIALDRPLPQALVHGLSPDAVERPGLHAELASEVLGVGQVQFTPEAAERVIWRLTINPERAKKGGALAAQIDTAFQALDPTLAAGLASQLWSGFSVSLDAAGQPVTLLPDEVSVSFTAKTGWAAAADAGNLLVLDVGQA
jgi:isoleucyl-tRNA synthetase